MAEAALTLPLITIIILGLMQVSLLAYGAILARYAAFSSLRSVATVAGADLAPMAEANAARIISRAPGLTMLWANLTETPLPLRGVSLMTRRFTMQVMVKVPRVLPSFRIIPVDAVTASCAMPMEPPR